MNFSPDGTTCILIIANTSTQTNCNISENTITLVAPPQNWANVLEKLTFYDNNYRFSFDVVITDANLAVRNHTFEMWKQ
jgi:hypothetical protein